MKKAYVKTTNKKRIISLLPAATEMVYALGLDENLVGISHDSDYPKATRHKRKVSRPLIAQKLTSREIDNTVKQYKHQGQSVFHIDEAILRKLKPDIILTQELCSVCAPSFTEVKKAAKLLSYEYLLVSLEPELVEDIFKNIELIAAYTNSINKAKVLIQQYKDRLLQIKKNENKMVNKKRASVLIIEWLDPLMVAGHWVPEMIAYAGGFGLIAKTGERSRPISWDEISNVDPDFLIVAPCGFTINRTKKEISLLTGTKNLRNLRACREGKLFLLDGNAYLTRPGPRIIDGIEILAEIMYPETFPRTHKRNAWQLLV